MTSLSACIPRDSKLTTGCVLGMNRVNDRTPPVGDFYCKNNTLAACSVIRCLLRFESLLSKMILAINTATNNMKSCGSLSQQLYFFLVFWLIFCLLSWFAIAY